MGTYRLLLAMLVLYSHTIGTLFGRNPGVVAVISFFVISGYVMTLMAQRSYSTITSIPAFYADRIARLFPQFLVYLTATIIIIYEIGVKDDFVSNITVSTAFLNYLMIPLGYFMFGLEHSLILPPTWSLGLECTFYLVFPFFFFAPTSLKIVISTFSFVVYILAFVGFLNTDFFGYRLLPGTFVFFSAGYWIASRNIKVVSSIWLGLLLLFVIVLYFSKFGGMQYNFEVTLGGLVGIIAVYLLSSIKRNWVDEYLGNLSYGVFLSHFFLLFIARRFDVNPIFVVPVGAIALSVLTFETVERPFDRWRRGRRICGLRSEAGRPSND